MPLSIASYSRLSLASASQIGKDGASAVISDVAWVLLDQARIIEGEALPDPAAFSRRLSALLEKGLG